MFYLIERKPRDAFQPRTDRIVGAYRCRSEALRARDTLTASGGFDPIIIAEEVS